MPRWSSRSSNSLSSWAIGAWSAETSTAPLVLRSWCVRALQCRPLVVPRLGISMLRPERATREPAQQDTGLGHPLSSSPKRASHVVELQQRSLILESTEESTPHPVPLEGGATPPPDQGDTRYHAGRGGRRTVWRDGWPSSQAKCRASLLMVWAGSCRSSCYGLGLDDDRIVSPPRHEGALRRPDGPAGSAGA